MKNDGWNFCVCDVSSRQKKRNRYLVHVDGSDKESKVLLGETCDEGHPGGDFEGAKGDHKDTHPNTHP